MKKLVAITVIAGLLMGLASVAMAGTETNWMVLMRASDPEYTFAALQCGVGTNSTKTDGRDVGDNKYTANTGNQAQAAVHRTDWGEDPALYVMDIRAPITDEQKIWDIRVWAARNYTRSQIRFAWWSISTYTPILVTPDWEYKIVVVDDPTGTFAAGTTWNFTPGATGTSTDPVGYVDFNVNSAIKMADADAVDNGIKLRFIAGPAVPEPSSMVALASGLFGLAGVAIRRRK